MAADPRPALLDAGDRLADALASGDLDGAAQAMEARQRLLDEAAHAELSAPSEALVERFEAQSRRLREAIDRQRTAVGDALGSAARAASAHDRYRSAGASAAPVLDTAPRRS